MTLACIQIVFVQLSKGEERAGERLAVMHVFVNHLSHETNWNRLYFRASFFCERT